MAKKICASCEKELGLLSLKVNISDGAICTKCLLKYGLTNISNPKSYTSSSIKQLINSRNYWVQSFSPTKSISTYLKIDENNKCFEIARNLFKYNNLLSFELLEDGETITKGGLGRAVAGGVLFGGVGAVVGGVTGGKKTKGICTSMKIKVSMKEAHCDVIYIPFITSETKKNSFTYKVAQENAQECISALEIIADENKYTDVQFESAQFSNVSSADEITKFKKLLDDGIITQEEFNIKKKQLLNL